MKKKIILITVMTASCILITIGVIAVVKNYISILNTTIQYKKDKSIISAITLENIKSIKMTAPRADELGFFFDMSKKEHIEMVKEILHWLKSGQIIVNIKDHEFISHGLPPAYLIIELKDKTIIKINSSYNGVTTHFPNKNVYSAQNVDGQVTIYVDNNMHYFRILSPELKSFIESGWISIFNYNASKENFSIVEKSS